jgi:hypothetical protein
MPFKTSKVGDALLAQYEQDPRYLMAIQSMQQGSSTAPVHSAAEGIARALQGGVGGYFAGKARRGYEEDQANQYGAIADILAPQPMAMGKETPGSAVMADGSSLNYSTPNIVEGDDPAVRDRRENIMKALQSGLVTPSAIGPSVVEALGFGKGSEYDTTPRVGVNPSTGKREQYVLDKQGNVKWLGVSPETKMEVAGNNVINPYEIQAGTRLPDTMSPEAEAQKARIAGAGRPATNIALNTERTFAGNVASNMAKQFTDNRDKASAAAAGIQALQEARALLDQGIYTGQMADLKLLGAKLGLGDTSKIGTTEAFQAAMGRQTLALVKNLGAGSGISNADREYAEKVAGGKITLNEESLRKIIDINERAQRGVIRGYNKEASRVAGAPSLSGLPVDLMVNEPAPYKPAPKKSGRFTIEAQ